jgi:glycosyltransferase involved in cell wall biosynthesis
MHIGVVTPAYNAERWVGKAIASVTSQSHDDWTMVVVDDGSRDATAEVVGEITDPRIRLVRQANAGVSAARNRGMQEMLHAGVDALIFLDADDWLEPNALARLVQALETSPDAVAAVGPFVLVDTGFGHAPPSGDLLERLLQVCFFGTGSTLVRRAAMEAAGGFRDELTFGEDWEFLVRLALRGPFVAVPEKVPVLFIQAHPSGLFRSQSADPAVYTPLMEAIFTQPALRQRFGRERLDNLRRRADANNAWAIGRELIRHGHVREGRIWLRRSWRMVPSAKRTAILAGAHALKMLPRRWLGPFQPYGATIPARRHRFT